ncbi:MAG: phage tail protein [Candidatus Xenobia bacterium]
MHSSLTKQDPPPAYRRGRPREYSKTPPERGGIPTGTILMYGGYTPPPGYLLCDGTPYQIADYPALFAAIGYNFQATQSGPTFQVPNLQQQFALGHHGSSADIGTTGGNANGQVTLTTANMPSHNHGFSDSGHTHGAGSLYGLNTHSHYYNYGSGLAAAAAAACTNNYVGVLYTSAIQIYVTMYGSTATGYAAGSVGYNGSGSAFSILPPYQVVNHIIRT